MHGPLRTLVGGQSLGQAADGLAQIAFAQFVIFEAGRGATPGRIAALMAVTLLPFSIVGPFAGVLIDRWSRRHVLVVMSVLRAALALAAVWTVAADSQPAAFVGVLLLLSTSRFVLAAKGAALPRTVASRDLVTANAISSIAGMTAVFVGAVSGAAVVGRTTTAGFVPAAALYLAAGVVFARLPDVGGGQSVGAVTRFRRAMNDVRDGLAATANPDIGRPLVSVWMHRFLLGAGFVLLVLVADSRFGLGISGYGLALAVTGVAAFAGSVAAPVCARRWSPTALLPVAFLPPAVATYAAGVAPTLVTLVAGVGVTAFTFQLLKVLVDALVGRAAPDEVRGRVFSAYDVVYNVAFVLAGLVMVPLWDPTRVRALLWWLAAAFLLGWLGCARLFGVWPFAARRVIDRPTRPWPARFAAMGCGALPVLAFPAVAWWWFAWTCLVPLLVVVRAAPTPREAAVRGWWGGAGFVTASAYWLAPAVGPALLLVAFGLGSLWLAWGWASWLMLAGRPSTWRLLAASVLLPSGWVAIEAVRSWASLGGPWALLGTSQWNQPRFLASAALGGVWLTSFLVVAANVALLAAAIGPGWRARIVLVGVATAALAVGPVWAAVRPPPTSAGAVRIAVVQPGVMEDPAPRLERQVRLSEELGTDDADLIVWGESSVAYDLRRSAGVTGQLVSLARRTGADVLVNVDARRDDGGIYKTSVLVTPDGMDGTYVKTRLVPFGEYVPLRPVLGWLSWVSDAAEQDRGRGDGPVLLRSGAATLGPLICFESTFPDMSRRAVAIGADLIVYQTASTTFQGTWAQPQHASLAAVRAVETGRPVIHAALTGTSAAFDALGNRLVWIDAGEQGTAVQTMTLTGGRTPYGVTGDWMLAVVAGVIAVALAGASLSSRSASGQRDTGPGRRQDRLGCHLQRVTGSPAPGVP